MTALPTDLLTRPAAQAARLIALGFLDDATEALTRLDQGDDGDALHDFRVASRRLRSTLRAYKRLLRGSVRKRQRRQLGDLARATNPGRDAEVQLGWLRGQVERLTPRERTGLRWLEARLDERVKEEYARVDSRIRRDFIKVSQRLRRRLAVYQQEVRTGGETPPTLGSVAADELRRDAAELASKLEAVTTPEEAKTAHAARIAAKRVRYLLEPIAPHLGESGGPALVRRLKGVQDRFGELADSHQFEEGLAAALAEAAGERARRTLAQSLEPGDGAGGAAAARGRDPRSGIIAVAKLVRARRNAVFSRIHDWLGGGGAEELIREIEAVASSLGPVAPATTATSQPAAEADARRRWRAKDRAR
jgi:CHAD domain-containing protein